jgi:predicted DNA binding CopG/RHH family protein
MKYKLTKDEIEIENAADKFVEFNDKEKNELDDIINKANLKKAITLRINENDLERIKFEAEKEGIPYQTFITSILHKYTTHQLVDEKLFIKFKELFVQ